jgi:hypothetical protein
MRIISLIIFVIILLRCSGLSQSNHGLKNQEIIIEHLTKDSVISFLDFKNDTLKILRKVEVLENENSDTITLGYSIIPPKFKGAIFFIQNGLDNSSAVYLDPNEDLDINKDVSYAKLFTISLFGQNPDKVFKRIKLKISLK